MKRSAFLITTVALACLSSAAPADQDILCDQVKASPSVDGRGDDGAWTGTPGPRS